MRRERLYAAALLLLLRGATVLWIRGAQCAADYALCACHASARLVRAAREMR